MKTLHVTQRTSAGRALALDLGAMGMTCESDRATPERGLANGVKYAVGGWGERARQDMMVQAADFPVMLVFTWRSTGEYLADVHIQVHDDHGREILTLNESGPIVLLGLDPGTYRIDVRRGRSGVHTRTLTVGPRTRRQAVFYWGGSGERS